MTLAVLGGYVFVSAAFTLPPSAARDVVDDTFAPYFSQSWDVFAPRILKVNSALEVQAQWRDPDGDLVHSEWIPVTETEMAGAAENPAPSRIGKNSVNAATTYISRYDELSPAQQERVEDTFIQETDDGFSAIPDADLIAEIEQLGEKDTPVIPFLRYDYMLIRFTAAYAEAYFDEPIERVRWRVRFDRPNDFEHRFESERQNTASYLTFGWRQPNEATPSGVVPIFRDVQNRYDR